MCFLEWVSCVYENSKTKDRTQNSPHLYLNPRTVFTSVSKSMMNRAYCCCDPMIVVRDTGIHKHRNNQEETIEEVIGVGENWSSQAAEGLGRPCERHPVERLISAVGEPRGSGWFRVDANCPQNCLFIFFLKQR